jgi:hypothetical protein
MPALKQSGPFISVGAASSRDDIKGPGALIFRGWKPLPPSINFISNVPVSDSNEIISPQKAAPGLKMNRQC